MTYLTPAERVTAWLNREADRDMISEADRPFYIKAMRDTFRAKMMELGYATDDLAASGPIGRLGAFLFLGWRPVDAKWRREAAGLDG